MDVRIVDRDALSAIPRASLRAYLLGSGWTSDGTWGDYAEVLVIETDDGKSEIAVPLRETVRTYANEVGQAIDLLSQIEERSQLDVHADVVAAGADVITLGVLNEVGRGPFSLHQSAYLQRDAAAMLTAAARSAERPRPAFAGTLSGKVTRFLDSIEIAPGPVDRFGIAVHIPVGPRIGQSDLFDDASSMPFGRRASTTLDRGLRELDRAVSAAAAQDRLEPFEEAVANGVSANLCQAVANLAEQAPLRGDGVGVHLRWAAVRPTNGHVGSSHKFGKHAAPMLFSASKFLREKAPDIDRHIVADVVRLNREPDEFDGHALLLADMEDRTIRIEATFHETDYPAVIKAFERRLPLAVDGILWHKGRSHQLEEPANVRVLDEDQ